MIIGIDLHKATHTAVALSSDEQELASKKVRSGGHHAEHLLAWAEPFEARTWAIESAGGLGYGTDSSAGYIQHPRPQFAAQSRRLVYVTAASDLGPTDSNGSPRRVRRRAANLHPRLTPPVTRPRGDGRYRGLGGTPQRSARSRKEPAARAGVSELTRVRLLLHDRQPRPTLTRRMEA